MRTPFIVRPPRWWCRFSHFSDDVVYLARDQLRLEELVKADDDVTKMAALSLKQQVGQRGWQQDR